MKKLKQLNADIYSTMMQSVYARKFRAGKISYYDENLIKQMRGVEFLGLPASVILLSRKLCAGRCHERAFLMAKTFLDANEEIRLFDASVRSLRLNPKVKKEETEHSFMERVTDDGQHFIYDTSDGLIYDKATYWEIEKPKIKRIYEKAEIMHYAETYENQVAEEYQNEFVDKALPIINESIALGESGESNLEPYAAPDNKKLQRELNLFLEKSYDKSAMVK